MLGGLLDRAPNTAQQDDLRPWLTGYGQTFLQTSRDAGQYQLLSGSYNAPAPTRAQPSAPYEVQSYGSVGRVEDLIRQKPSPLTDASSRSGAPDKGDIWALLAELTGSISGPEDWAVEHDHYIHGTPKRQQR